MDDGIHQRPKLQRDVFDVLLRFRRFPVVVLCDIVEMYLRIGLHPEDESYHRFLSSGTNPNRIPGVYDYDRVVFVKNSSPSQAQFVLLQHAKKYKSEYPMAAETADKSTYMDDSLNSG